MSPMWRTSPAVAWLAAWALALAALTAAAQSASEPAQTAGELVAAAAPPRGEFLREIDDPSTGDRWLLLRDPARPAGPARLVLDAEDRTQAASRMSAPVIHAGDALILEEHTALIDARLEAVALSRAATGAEFPARLAISGKVVRAVAVAPGRAVMTRASAAGSGAWR